MMGEPFKVGDAVWLASHGDMWNAQEGTVKTVHKNGNFTVIGYDGQFRAGGGKVGANWAEVCAYHATPEKNAEIAESRAERQARNLVYAAAEAMRNRPADRHPAIAALLSDELLTLLGVTR